jgi:hypothetical protein
MVNFITSRYSRQGLWSLFLICAFPLHLWTLILAFRDVSWLTERTNVRDAIGVVSYGMLFALIESILIFLVLVLIGLITPWRWEPERRITFLAFLVLIISVWAMIGQLLFLWNVSLPNSAIEFLRREFLRRSDHPLRITYAVCLMVVTPTVLLPAYSFLRTSKAVTVMQNLMERLSLLSIFYLVFDLLGVIIIVFRNL